MRVTRVTKLRYRRFCEKKNTNLSGLALHQCGRICTLPHIKNVTVKCAHVERAHKNGDSWRTLYVCILQLRFLYDAMRLFLHTDEGPSPKRLCLCTCVCVTLSSVSWPSSLIYLSFVESKLVLLFFALRKIKKLVLLSTLIISKLIPNRDLLVWFILHLSQVSDRPPWRITCLQVLIGSLHCLCYFWLVRAITQLKTAFKPRSKNYRVYKLIWSKRLYATNPKKCCVNIFVIW